MANETHSPTSAAAPSQAAAETRFVNGMRLNTRHWLAVIAIVATVLSATPWLWKRIERFDTGPDYRIPYAFSKDYWLYERRLQRIAPTNIVVVGDSVVWGEYVRADGTLSHFLNGQSGQPGRFVNAGVNGMFPLALEGLVRYYGAPLRNRKVILHANLLWMTSPKADLRTEKEERFNHADLVPQFSPRIPCYKATLDHRLGAVVGRNFGFSQWATHLQIACFDQKNILNWTLEEDGGNPPRQPNAYKNPLAQIRLAIPPEPDPDPERGPSSPRHKPWSTTGEGSTSFEWVDLNQSLQWAAFQRLVALLQSRGNDVLVVMGPFNEQIMAAENRPAFRHARDLAVGWLSENHVAHIVPEPLPSALYADASHPLTEGYRRLAESLWNSGQLRNWMTSGEAGTSTGSR
jgi:hypothetical protein